MQEYRFRQKSYIFILMVFLMSFSSSYAQSIQGIILEEHTNEVVFGASISVVNSNPIKGAVSDENGEFVIEPLGYGNYSLSVSFIGYKTLHVPDVNLTSGKETRLEIYLERSNTELEEVKVVAKNYNSLPTNALAVASVKSITFEQSERIPGSFNDPARLAQAFAGVTTSDDASNIIVVRGNSPNGILWRMEGLEIPNPSHFFSSTVGGGVVSMVSTYMLKKSDFYSGAFPSELGNATAAAFDLNLRTGNPNQFEANLRLGVLGLDAMLEGPLSKKNQHSYVVNYRYSTISLAQKIDFSSGGRGDGFEGLSSDFQDINVNFNFKLKDNANLNFYGLGGFGTSLNKSTSSPYQWDSFYKLGVAGLNYRKPLSSNHLLQVKGALNWSFNGWSDGNNLSAESFQKNFSITEEVWTYRLGVNLNSYIGKNANLRYGANLNYHLIDLRRRSFNYNQNRVNVNNRFSGSDEAVFAQWYFNYKQKINTKWILQSGIYGSYFQFGNHFSVEPRASIKYNFLPNQHIYASAGLHSQLLPLSFYVTENDNFDVTQYNRNVGLINAVHLVGGYTYDFKKNVSLKTELYYQYLYNLPVHDPSFKNSNRFYISLNDLENYSQVPVVKNGLGRNFGLEFTIEKHYEKQYFLLFNTSLYSSKFKLNKEDFWKNTRYNGNYIFNLSFGKDFTVGRDKQNRIGVGTKLLAYGGQRFISFDKDEFLNTGNYIRSEDLLGRANAYLRWDVRLSYLRNKKKYSWELSLDVQNVTNHANERLRTFDFNALDYNVQYQFGILPILKYSLMLTKNKK